MTDDQDNNHITKPSLCISCGRPIAKGFHCNECIERGLGSSCPGCEGLSLLDVEEGDNG